MRSAARLLTLVTVVALVQCARSPEAPSEPFDVVEATIAEMQEAMADGRVTSREIVEQYLARIGLYENDLNAAP